MTRHWPRIQGDAADSALYGTRLSGAASDKSMAVRGDDDAACENEEQECGLDRLLTETVKANRAAGRKDK